MWNISENIKNTIRKEFGVILSVRQLKKTKKIYKIKCSKKVIRLDCSSNYCKWWDIHNFAYKSGINVAKEFLVFNDDNMYIRICDFILGSFPDKCDNIEDAYIKAGEEMAKLNNIMPNLELIKNTNLDITNFRLTNSDFSSPNSIYTKDKKLFIIDTNTFKILKLNTGEVDYSLVNPLLRWIRKKHKINFFLKGYSKFRDPTDIIKICKMFNWKWNPNLNKECREDIRNGISIKPRYYSC
jgi:hypothetical protein